MGISAKQIQALRRNLNAAQIRTRRVGERDLSYIEAWHAIGEANRIFGFDGWSRETVESRCLSAREVRGAFQAVYVAKVRITVHFGDRHVVRDGHGTGEGRGASPAEAHDMGLKTAETDATKRSLATFGKPFGLSLYLQGGAVAAAPTRQALSSPSKAKRVPHSGHDVSEESPSRAPPIESRQVVPLVMPKRLRDKEHLLFVAAQPCLVCGRQPADAHHLRFAQPQAMSLKVSDEFTVPLCRIHHRQLHHSGNELAWWNDLEIDALEIAKGFWDERNRRQNSSQSA